MNIVAYSNIYKHSKTLEPTEKYDKHVLQLLLIAINFASR